MKNYVYSSNWAAQITAAGFAVNDFTLKLFARNGRASQVLTLAKGTRNRNTREFPACFLKQAEIALELGWSSNLLSLFLDGYNPETYEYDKIRIAMVRFQACLGLGKFPAGETACQKKLITNATLERWEYELEGYTAYTFIPHSGFSPYTAYRRTHRLCNARRAEYPRNIMEDILGENPEYSIGFCGWDTAESILTNPKGSMLEHYFGTTLEDLAEKAYFFCGKSDIDVAIYNDDRILFLNLYISKND